MKECIIPTRFIRSRAASIVRDGKHHTLNAEKLCWSIALKVAAAEEILIKNNLFLDYESLCENAIHRQNPDNNHAQPIDPDMLDFIHKREQEIRAEAEQFAQELTQNSSFALEMNVQLMYISRFAAILESIATTNGSIDQAMHLFATMRNPFAW